MAYKQISPIPVVEGGSGITTATAYGTLCGGTTTTGAFQVVAPGTSGQILTSGGAGALPSFSAAPSGTLILIQTQTPAGVASITFTSGISATYNNYLLFSNVKYSTSSGNHLLLQLSSDGGSTYKSTGYVNSGSGSYSYVGTAGLGLLAPTGSLFPSSAVTSLYNLTSGTSTIMGSSAIATYSTGGGNCSYSTGFSMYNTGALTVNALKIVDDASFNFTGTFSLYGITN